MRFFQEYLFRQIAPGIRSGIPSTIRSNIHPRILPEISKAMPSHEGPIRAMLGKTSGALLASQGILEERKRTNLGNPEGIPRQLQKKSGGNL